MLLYDSQVSGNCYKVRLLLAQLGFAYQRQEVDVIDRSSRNELLGDLNPTLRVPTLLLDDGRSLGESNAILWYLARDTQYVPEDDFERAKVLQWSFFEQYSHEPYIAVVRFWVSIAKAPPGRDELDAKRKGGYAALDVMERHLAASPFSSPIATQLPISPYTPTRAAASSAEHGAVTRGQRRGRDSNPRRRNLPRNGFRDRRIQPLCHPSKASTGGRA
jgi:glutathione S-transferase